MLKSLELRNFTTFGEARLEFGTALNVLVGENGTGKSHLLKLAYSIIYAEVARNTEISTTGPTKSYLQSEVARKVTSVFKPDELGRLARRDRQGRRRCEVRCDYGNPQNNIGFSFNTSSRTEVTIDVAPNAWIEKVPVFLPTRELLTIYPGFVSLYETTHLPFEETWRDTCILLGAPLARGPREREIGRLLAPLETAMGGRVELTESGKFYLNIAGVRMEMHLVAEGLRKLAMVARLIATGSLVDKGFLFWDEPESNLNPLIIKVIARVILELGKSGLQVFIASHSLFLVREIDILLHSPEFEDHDCRFFSLLKGDDGVTVHQGNTADDIGELTFLQEELGQSDRYLEMDAVA